MLDFNDLERQVTDAHTRYAEAVRDSTRAQLLLICLETREQAPHAVTIEFGESDQGTFLMVDRVLDAAGDEIEGYFDDDGRAWDLDTDKPASCEVWAPVVETQRPHVWHLNIDAAVEKLTT